MRATTKRVFIFLVFFFPSHSWAAEGVSNSLLNIHSAGILEKGLVEFSPTFNLSFPNASKPKEGEFSFRTTFGILDSWEIGLNIPIIWNLQPNQKTTGLGAIGIGSKWNVYENTAHLFKISLLAGIKFNTNQLQITPDLGATSTLFLQRDFNGIRLFLPISSFIPVLGSLCSNGTLGWVLMLYLGYFNCFWNPALCFLELPLRLLGVLQQVKI